MRDSEEDGPKVSIHPPTVFLTALVSGYVLRLLTGGYLPLPRGLAEGIGGAFLIGAVVLLLASMQTFVAGGETLTPATASQQLFTKGPYRYTRNPIYLGFLLFGIGFGFATSNVWVLLTTALSGGVLNYFVIQPEEKYLRRRFGDEYETYCKSVRRWV